MAWRYDQARIDARRAEINERSRLAAEADWAATPMSSGLCYFIGCDEGLVKIGFSRNVSRRLSALRATSGPYRLNLLAIALGGRSRERHYHRLFAEHAVGGEWFTRRPEIEAEIARLAKESENHPQSHQLLSTPRENRFRAVSLNFWGVAA